jgi:hypothetical protein
VRPTDAGKSYFWADAGIAAGVLTGLLMLGLWGDRAIGGAIFGMQLLCMGAGAEYPQGPQACIRSVS